MNNEPHNTSEPSTRTRGWFERIGPGLITVCVVIGPGSVLTSSQTGAKYGFSMVWVVLVAVIFMLVYMTLGAKLGVVSGQSAGKLIAERAGRWLAVLVGVGVFLVSASFQFGNNLGVHSAFATYIESKWLNIVLVVGFNVLSLVFLFGFRNLYSALERLMTVFVALMLISFAINLVIARPNLAEFARGVVPDFSDPPDISVLGLFGTTFVIASAFYQSYLVRQKGWGRSELRTGLMDSRLAAGLMALITLMIMSTAASVLRGQQLKSVSEVAEQLKPAFGDAGQFLFCLGLFSAAYSSFLINSMVGGFTLADGLGYSSEPTDMPPRVLTAAVLLSGMGVALFVILTGIPPVAAIVMGQAVTVLVSPLLAATLIWLTNCRSIMGEDASGFVLNVVSGLGFVLLVGMASYTAVFGVWPKLQPLLNQ